jgi:hypothetical protein
MRNNKSIGSRPWTDASKGWAESVERKEDKASDIELLLVPEKVAAAMLGVSARTVWELGKAGEVETRKIGRRKNYLVSSLKKFARNCKEVA